MKARATLMTITFLLAITAGTAYADRLSDIKARGSIICGVVSTLAPFGFQDQESREVVGYDIDFCKGIAKELGVRPELKVVSLESRIPELQQGRVDFLTAVLGYNPERAQQISFSKYNFVSEMVIAAKADSAYKRSDDLGGKRVSIIKGSSGIPVVQKVLPTVQLVRYDDGPSAFLALVQSKVDGLLLSETLLRRFMEKLGPDAKDIVVLNPPVGKEYWAIGVKKDESKLLNAINDALDGMETSGQSNEIFEKWLGEKSTLKMTRDFKTGLIPTSP